MPSWQFFVTGTDTGVGKTFVSCQLLLAAEQLGLSTLGLKPIASGCEWINGEWQNEDALALKKHASVKLPYADINPIALPRAIAPHLAAEAAGKTLTVSDLKKYYQTLQPSPAAFTLLEGAGGWYVPLNAKETFSDFVTALKLPVILVVGIRLGCINHALLTAAAIQSQDLKLAGWVANCPDPDTDMQDAIVATLAERLLAPMLGKLPYCSQQSDTHQLNQCLDLSNLLN